MERLFFIHRQWLSGDASKNTFDLVWWAECCDLTRFWDVLELNYFYQIGCRKQAMPSKMQIQHFFFCATKPIHDAGIAPPFVLLNNTSLFFLNNFFYNCTLLNLDLSPRKVSYVAFSMWLADIHTFTWFTKVIPLIVTMPFFIDTFRY